ncbi:Similar to rst: Irregular chiasm C-roughest protein (Drosophila melanogaster) [Cotesia congregata]|uniref:Similar to rst: Irregular chiasm C-roughest protein (Drosophila melanogaster) n=1 Tax=Cotesia congregata TaxID=51543 RepID=A0A8J2HLK0_COTCN|nr:Similar to rst: Irregular chiasm C-roughest protein (Drosophila melanogaster) [Cotesia congregata]
MVKIRAIVIACFMSGVVFVGVNSEQRFIETPPSYQEVSSGEDVKLVCKVQDKKGQCIWQKDRKPVGMHPDKYEWANGRGGGGGGDADCTLLIRRASLDFDDGLWECQVTPGDFTRQDALTSLASRLLVRVKPRKPSLEYGGTIMTGALTLREGQEVTISCVSRYGNPPALIKWFIGGDEVEPLREQTNATEVDSPKTWAAHSLLRIKGARENHGLPIRCLSLHSSSPLPAIAESRLDIHYSPEVHTETSPRLLTSALEDSASFMSIKCIADANPPAAIRWYKDSVPLTRSNSIDSFGQNSTHRNGTMSGSEIRFEPVKQTDAGLYTCKGINVIGESSPANYRLDIQYGPRMRINDRMNNTNGEVEVTALLASTVDPFECDDFDANPPARYRWVHLRGGVPQTIDNSVHGETGSRRLSLKNVIWSNEGEYRCVAFNIINGVRREMSSDTRFILHVSGPPEIQTRRYNHNNDDDNDRLSDNISMDESIAWVGESIEPKYEALPLEPIKESNETTNCYYAKLEIRDLQKEDSRVYNLLIESEKGRDTTSLRLIVRDPMEIKIIAIAGGIGLLLLFVIIGLVFYAILKARHRKYQKKRAEEEDENSIAADAFYTTTPSINRQKTTASPANKVYVRKSPSEGGLAVMYDYNQIVKHSRTLSPEALKIRRAAAVLQPPTIV